MTNMTPAELANYATALQDSCRFVRFSAAQWRGHPAVYDAERDMFAPFQTEYHRNQAIEFLNETPTHTTYFWDKR